jgi:hypothetical protein
LPTNMSRHDFLFPESPQIKFCAYKIPISARVTVAADDVVDALELVRRCSKEQELSTENLNMYTVWAR